MSVHSRPRVTALGLGSRGRAYQVASLPFQLASPAVSALMGDAVAGPLIAKTFARITPVTDLSPGS